MATDDCINTMHFVGNGHRAIVTVRYRSAFFYEYEGNCDDLKRVGVLHDAMLPSGRKRKNVHFESDRLSSKDWKVEKKKNNRAVVVRWTGKNAFEKYPFISAADGTVTIGGDIANLCRWRKTKSLKNKRRTF